MRLARLTFVAVFATAVISQACGSDGESDGGGGGTGGSTAGTAGDAGGSNAGTGNGGSGNGGDTSGGASNGGNGPTTDAGNEGGASQGDIDGGATLADGGPQDAGPDSGNPAACPDQAPNGFSGCPGNVGLECSYGPQTCTCNAGGGGGGGGGPRWFCVGNSALCPANDPSTQDAGSCQSGQGTFCQYDNSSCFCGGNNRWACFP